MNNPVIILGAGATKECGGPLTNEILPKAFSILGIEEDSLRILGDFLKEQFYVPLSSESRDKDDFPPLPLLLSLVDTAIDRKHAFGADWPIERVREVRASIEYAIFTVLKKTLRKLPPDRDFHQQLFDYFPKKEPPTVISLNYDIIVDNAFAKLGRVRSRRKNLLHMPDYGTDITPSRGRQSVAFGRLLKIHGSLHWMYCPGCSRLKVNIARTRNYFVKGIWNRDVHCENCQAQLQVVMITPTHLKDYRNPHIARVWYEAEQALRNAQRVIIIGYSLPDDDIEVAYLLKRGLERFQKKRVTVVGHDPEGRSKEKNPTWQRYKVLFGSDFEWRPDGFKHWLAECKQRNRNPLQRRLDGIRL